MVDYLLARRDEPCGRSVPEAVLKSVEKVAEVHRRNVLHMGGELRPRRTTVSPRSSLKAPGN